MISGVNASILSNWFCVDNTTLQTVMLKISKPAYRKNKFLQFNNACSAG
jgi:hypothetical protein